MTRYFLKSMAVEGFRGINNDGDPLVLNFKTDAVNSVHAPNGVGKSSIYDALHFAIFGTVPRLEELQEAEDGQAYVLNRFHPRQEATINLTFASDDGTPDVGILVTRNAAGQRNVSSPTRHPQPQDFLKLLQEDFALVDYQRFSGFVNTTPLVRGRSFAALLGLSGYSRMRQCLESAKRTLPADLGLPALEAEVNATTRHLAAVETRVMTTFETSTGSPATLPLNSAAMQAAVTTALASIALLTPLITGKTVMNFDFAAAEALVDKTEGGDARKELEQIGNTLTALGGLSVTAEEMAEVETLLAIAKRRDEAFKQAGSSSLHDLLQSALTVVSDAEGWPDPLVCPVCDTKVDAPLPEKLAKQIAIYETADNLTAELLEAARGSAWIQKLPQIEADPTLAVPPEEQAYPNVFTGLRAGSLSTVDIEKVKASLTALEPKRQQSITDLTEKLTALQASLPPSLIQVTRTLQAAKQFRDACSERDGILPTLEDKTVRVAKLNRWKAFMAEAVKAFAKGETALSTGRITQIQTTSQDLFKSLVRGGPDVKPTLKRVGSTEGVELKLADFHGLTDVSARALLSESYRNAVAASVFFSSASKHSGTPRFVVLDDVTSSFDAGHQVALMEAIRMQLRHGRPGVTDGLQFIILSHDTTLEKYFDRLNGTPDWHHQKLQGMPPKGRLMVSAQEADRLKVQAQTYLNAGQIDIGEPFVRQYLEYKLGQVISNLQIPVPPDYAARGDKRTLSSFMDAITGAVSLYQAAGRCVLQAQQITDLTTRHATAIMANYVSHYETGAGTPFNAYALLGVLQSVDDLADCFTYTDASGQKKNYRRLDSR